MRNGLASFAAAHKAAPSIARDPYDVLELLTIGPAGMRLVLHWAGDDALGEQTEAPLATQALEVVLGYNLGLSAQQDSALIQPGAGRPALLQLVSDLRQAVLALEFPTEVTMSYLAYAGCKPVVTPEGIPLAAYRMAFTLDASIPVADQYSPVTY